MRGLQPKDGRIIFQCPVFASAGNNEQMEDRTDSQLLRQYAREGSEVAFEAVMRRHIDFVYSAALRMVVDPHLAEDVTQGVFLALANSARSLAGRPVISGWLHRTARNLAAKAVRTEVRRRHREQASMEITSTESEPLWHKLAPVLDTALGELSDAERDILLLRFFENRTAAEISSRLQITEAAAQKRVTRAVEKLRSFLGREGIAVSCGALAALLGTQAVSAAPANLAATTIAVLANSSLSTGMGVGLLEILTMTKVKVIATSALIVTAVLGPLIVHHRTLNDMRAENRWLREQAAENGAPGLNAEELSKQLAKVQAEQALSKAQLAELLRLRGEVALLRKESQELARLRREPANRPAPDADEPKPFVPSATWANVGAADPESALQTFLWAGKHRATNLVADLVRVQRDPDIPESSELDERFATTIISASSWFSGTLQGFRVLSLDADADDMMRIGMELANKDGKTTPHKVRFVREGDQWFPVMHVWLQEPGSVRAALDVPAKFAAR